MFFTVSKTISFIAKPLGILFLLALILLFTKNNLTKKRISIAFLIILYVFSCPAIINPIIQTYEFPAKSINSLQIYNYGIVLTGGLINESMSIDSSIHLGSQGDRLWQTAEIYKAGKIKKVIISGGDGYKRMNHNNVTENSKAKDFLIKVGVKATDIIQEDQSVNTHENAKFSKKILKQYNKEKVLIITSAFHLKRALACFKKQNVDVDGFAAAIISENHPFKWQDLIPSQEALRNCEILANEAIGMITYKIFGYI